MKYIFYVIGILLLTMGIAFTIQSDLGTSPFDAVLILITAVITGIGIDFWLFVLGDLITLDSVQSKAVCFGIGLLLIGIGTATYLHTNLAPIPVDRLTLMLEKITGTNLFVSRI